MNIKKKFMVPVYLCLTLLICGGCGFSLDKSHYAYIPSEKLSDDIKSLPVTVVINYLDDMRGRAREEYTGFILLPLVPYASSHYDRPEIENRFGVKSFNPSEDFAKALMQEMKQNNLFSDVSLAQENYSKNADLVVTGRIIKASIDTKATLYGLSIFGFGPWIVGMPQGKVYNELNVEYEMRRTYDNAVVWKCEVKGDWNRIFALYYNYSKDEPYTGMNEILRQNLRLGMSELAEIIKHEPLEYWKH